MTSIESKKFMQDRLYAAHTHTLALGDKVVDAKGVPVESLGTGSDHPPQFTHVVLQ